MWANGDVGNSGFGRDTSLGLAEVGACGSSEGLTLGAGLGNTWQIPSSQVLLLSLAMCGRYNVDIKRRYANGAGESNSKGSTSMDVSTLRLLADWLDAATVVGVTLSPWASVTSSKTRVDAYMEASGTFPAHFDSQDQATTEAVYQLCARTTLLGTVETVHSMDGQGPNISCDGVGLFSLDQSGQNLQKN